MENKNIRLLPEEIQKTIETLHVRIAERFPDSGLAEVCNNLLAVSKETENTVQWIARPNYLLRAVIYLIVACIAAGMVYSTRQLQLTADGLNISDFVQMVQSAMEAAAFIGAGFIFLVTFENRRKRKRVIRAVNRLRCFAHIIDAHQLTKDPESTSQASSPTPHSPKRGLSGYELGRYLDYCSEMLSLAGKLAFLYVQDFHDTVAADAVNDLETLATGLERKIWQKIMILDYRGNR